MQLFTPYEYVKMSISNGFGYNKKTWNERLEFANEFISQTHEEQVKYALAKSKEPMMTIKAINANRDAINGVASGFLFSADASASGIQLLSVLTGCKQSAARCNVINTGKREDPYKFVIERLNKELNSNFELSDVKQALMTSLYGSTEQPKVVFGENTPELAMFYQIVEEELKGCWNALQTMNGLWNPSWKRYSFELLDGHVVDIPVMAPKDFKIEIAEFNKATFTFRTKVNHAKEYSRELAANITHSVDSYVVREMYRKAHKQGWELATIHDDFFCAPSNANQMRLNYAKILSNIAKSDLFTQILQQLTGNTKAVYKKYSDDLHLDILNSEYAIC